jgi:hypothetical protein
MVGESNSGTAKVQDPKISMKPVYYDGTTALRSNSLDVRCSGMERRVMRSSWRGRGGLSHRPDLQHVGLMVTLSRKMEGECLDFHKVAQEANSANGLEIPS